ncbi:MAG TPA: hypothetical protein VIK18_11525 [Pirellulales bacterium]
MWVFMASPLAVTDDGDSWRPARTPRWRRVLRFVSRVLMTLLAVALLSVFFRNVFEPWSHGSLRVVALTGANYDGLQVPPLAFQAEDLAALAPIAKIFRGGADDWQVPALASPQALSQLTGRLNANLDQPDEMLVIYVAAHGVSVADSAYLLCGNFDAARPAAGRIPLRELLTVISRAPADNKLLLLDVGRVTYDPRLGVLVNDFPELLAREVAALGDPTLWVLSATSSGERSHVSSASQRSVFGFYLEQAFGGAADSNADGAIGLGELQRFVSKAVSDCVQEATAGAETQTPLLIAGSADPARALPIIGPPVRLSRVPRPPPSGAFAADFRRQASAAKLNVVAAPTVAPMQSPTASIGGALLPAFNNPVPGVLPTLAAAKGAGAPQAPASQTSATPAPAPAADAAAKPGSPPAGAEPGPVAGKPAGAEPAKTAGTPATSANSLAELASALVAAWQVRDELDRLPEPQTRPLDSVPHRWRALQARLLGLEQESLAGKSADPTAIRRRLEQLVAALKRSDLSDEAEDILLPNARGQALVIQKSIQPRGLALAAALASRNGRPVPADFATAVRMLDLAAAGRPDDGFWKWLDSLGPRQDGYVELQSARQFRAMPGISRELLAQTLQVCWLGERVAADAWGVQPWVEPAVDAADRQRLTAERDLLDPGRLRDDRELSNSLRQAAELYRQAGQRLKTASAAQRLAHDLLDRAADYVRWHNLGPIGASAPVPDRLALERLLDELAALVQKLARPDAAALAEIEQIVGRLEELKDEVESDLRPAFVASLLDRPGPAAWNASLLLATPLPALPARLRLLAAVDRLDRPLEPVGGMGPLHATASLAGAAGEQLGQALERRADLQLRLARLAMIDSPHGPGPLETLEARYRATIGEKSGAANMPAASATLERWRKLGAAFEDFYAALPELIQSSLGHTSLHSSQLETTLRHWRWADLASRLIDPRDVVRVKDLMPAQLVERAEFDALLAWQRTRLLATSRQTTAQQAKYLVEVARDYFAALTADGYDVPPNAGAQPLELRVAAMLDMRRTGRLETELAVQAGERAGEVWLVAEYDPELIGLRPAPGHPLYVMDQASAASDRSSAPRVRALLLPNVRATGLPPAGDGGASSAAARLFDTAPSLKLGAGAWGELKLIVDRKSPSRLPAALIVSAWTRDTVTRQAIEIRLPQPAFVRLAVDAQAGCWAPAGSGLKLYPFPNRTTPYRFLISRTDEPAQKVSAELRLLAARPDTAVPDTAMDADEAADVLDQLPSSTRLAVAAETVLPAAGHSVPVAFEPAPPPPQPAAKSGAAPAADTPPSLQNGILVVLTDLASKRVVMRWIELMPQRPRRYVEPHVDYDLAEERVRLRVRSRAGATLPPEGSRIRWQLTGLDEGAVPGPAGEITSAAPERVLSTRLAPQVNPVLLLVDVDDYPRAFAFRIDSRTTALDLPQAELTAIKITAPPARTAYRLPAGPIPVRLEADAPSDDLSGSEDFIEVGLDTNRDRILNGEPSVRLTADRRTSVTLDKLAPGGTLEVRTQVQDLAVEVPTVSLASGRVAVLGRVHLGGKSVWSNSVELILDGEPPTIERVTLKPGAKIVRGTKLDVLATATDGDLSGVASVEVAFDLKNEGHFTADPKPLPAAIDASGRWAVQLPTDALGLGGYQLLLRATDRVGNVSEYKSVTVRIVTAESAEKPLNQVSGSVTYGKEPMPQIQITLAPEKGEKLPPVTSDARGNFVIRSVLPGKYTLTAKGVVRNKVRKAEAKLEVGPPPLRPKPITLELK